VSSLVCSGTMDCEFLDDWICQQFGGEFSNANGLGFADSRCSRIAGVFLLRARCTRLGRPLCPAGNGRPFGVGDLNLESFALANGNNLGEAEPMAGAGNCLALRVVDLGLEHDVHNYLGHTTQRNAGPPLDLAGGAPSTVAAEQLNRLPPATSLRASRRNLVIEH
jgi:hypothetical protein